MKGAFLISTDADLFQQVNEYLAVRGGKSASDGVAQIMAKGVTLFTVFGGLGDEFAADLEGGIDEIRGEFDVIPDLSAQSSCWIECGSEEVFVDLVQGIAQPRSNPTWVLDGDGILWTVEALDSAELRL